MRSPVRRFLAVALPCMLLLAGCATPGSGNGNPSDSPAPASPVSSAETLAGGSLIVYSGRSEELVGPLIKQFAEATGLDVKVKYGSTSEIAATILEEGERSPADVFLAQDAGALGAIAKEGRFAPLPATTLDRVEPRFQADDGLWVGVSGRARVAAYDTRVHAEGDLPTSILDFTDASWRGKLGWAPTNGSFQAFVTAFRVLRGHEAATAWLKGILANEPKVYEGNNAIIAAVASGEIEIGFVNHYYALRQIDEQGESFPVRNHFFAGDDPGALVNVSGVGILSTSKNPAAARAFVDFLLSDAAQAYLAEAVYEYPLAAGITLGAGVRPLGQVTSPDIDLSDLDDLEGTLRLLQDAGVL